MASYTYGIDQAQVARWFPNIGIGVPGNPVSSDVVADLINEACGKVNSRVSAAGVTPSEVTAADFPDQYYTMRALVRDVMRPEILNEAHHDTTQAADYDTWVERAEAQLEKLEVYPERFLGPLYRRHDTSTKVLGLKTSESARDKRWRFREERFRVNGTSKPFDW